MTKRISLTGIRGMIAKRMLASVQETAQLSFHCDCDATMLVAAREAWKAAGRKVGYEDLIVHTLAGILLRFPQFNALEGEGVVEPQAALNIGCAIGLPGSLVAPAIFNVEEKSVEQIAAARQDLVARALAGKLTVKEMTGSTITISNLGLTRVRHFTPILNRPQQAIIGLGQIAKRPWVEDQTLSVRDVIGLSLTVDHRVIDGQPAGEFLSALATALETQVTRP